MKIYLLNQPVDVCVEIKIKTPTNRAPYTIINNKSSFEKERLKSYGTEEN